VKKYGWTKRFNADVMNYWNEICCGGNTPRTGIPYDLVTVGWYYNPQIFAKHNLKPPTTMAQFQAVMAKLKANGVVPFAAGGLNVANPGSLHYVFEQLVHAIVPRATIQQLVLRNPNATWTDPGIVQALTISQQWAKAGYLEENALATSGADADSMFINGDAAMTLNGTWKTQQFLQATTFTPRFFATPRINLKQPWTLGGYSPNNQWMISSFASDKNLGAQYVDFMLGPKAAMTLWNNGDIPAFRFKHTPKPKSLVQTDVYQAMGKARTGFYLGVGGFFTTQYRPTLETLFNFSKTPQQVAQQLQENYLRLVNGG
jgi:raffinose/stachyose/melibiose transport system substrate-binding protein